MVACSILHRPRSWLTAMPFVLSALSRIRAKVAGDILLSVTAGGLDGVSRLRRPASPLCPSSDMARSRPLTSIRTSGNCFTSNPLDMGRCKVQPLQIKPVPTRDRRGDLRARVHDGTLLVPERVVVALSPLNVRDAVDLLSYLQAFPSSVASQLGWDTSDVHHALSLLRGQLRGLVDKEILDPPVRTEPSYGALHPSTANGSGSDPAPGSWPTSSALKGIARRSRRSRR